MVRPDRPFWRGARAISARSGAGIKMGDKPDSNLEGLDIDLVRRIDAICRQFEADWRADRQPRLEDYLGEVPDACRTALRAELEALLAELRPPEGPETDPGIRTERPPSTIAEAPTIAPRTAAAQPLPGDASTPVHEELTVRPSARTPPVEPRVVGGCASVRNPRHLPASATSATTRSSARSRAAAWAWSSRPGR